MRSEARTEDAADVVARLTTIASIWVGRYRGALGNSIDRDELVAEGWLALQRTGSWVRAEGAMRDILRASVRERDRRGPATMIAVAPSQALITDPRQLAWEMRSQGYLLRQIGSRVGVSTACVSQWLKALERDRGEIIEGVVRITPLRRVRAPVRERLVPILRKRRTTIAQICRDFGVSRKAAAAALTAAQGDRPWRRSDLRNGVRCARGHELAKTRRVSASGKLYCVGCRNHSRRWYRRRVAERKKREKREQGV